MSQTQSYQVPRGEEDHYHLKCIFRRHDEANQQYIDDVHIIKLSEREYPQWDKNKGVNGFSSVTVLHDPTKKKEVGKELFPVVYLGEDKEMSKEEMKAILADHKIEYFKGAKAEKLVQLIAEIKPEE